MLYFTFLRSLSLSHVFYIIYLFAYYAVNRIFNIHVSLLKLPPFARTNQRHMGCVRDQVDIESIFSTEKLCFLTQDDGKVLTTFHSHQSHKQKRKQFFLSRISILLLLLSISCYVSDLLRGKHCNKLLLGYYVEVVVHLEEVEMSKYNKVITNVLNKSFTLSNHATTIT